MADLLFKVAVFAALGLATGFLSGLLGVGGSMVRIPIFVHLLPSFGIASAVLMHVSLGTSMALILPTSILAAYKQYRHGNLDLGYYHTWAVGVLAGVLVGLVLLPHVSSQLLKVIFLVFLTAMTIYISFLDERLKAATQPPQGAVKLSVAAGVGCISMLTGTGGGITTPSMKAFSMPLKNAIALASATGLVVSTAGTTGMIVGGWNAQGLPNPSLGFVDPVIWLIMLPTILLAVPVGVRVNNNLSKQWLKRIYIAFLVTNVINMAIATLRG